ncbi:hypothetical protein GCM10010381_52250 [Streptomyces xantholiticus]|nr:hypothetical protein GCM10010381_52250 [Streptomyces xantholiticus]
MRSWRSERLDSAGAETTVAKSYRLLKAMLETAVEDELIRANPCRIQGAGKETAAERPVATVDHVDALAYALGPRWRLMVYLGAYGPLRPEEQAELRRKDVDDVDLDNLTIRAREAAPELTTGKRAEGPTKSEAGKRSSSCRPFCGPTFDGTSTGTRRRARTDSCSWGEGKAVPALHLRAEVAKGPYAGWSPRRLPLLRSSSHRAHPDDRLGRDPEGHDGAGRTVDRASRADLSALGRRASAGGRGWSRQARPAAA